MAAFPDVMEHTGRCCFRGCAHGDEPACAVREALKAGSVDSRRVRSYLQLAGGST